MKLERLDWMGSFALALGNPLRTAVSFRVQAQATARK